MICQKKQIEMFHHTGKWMLCTTLLELYYFILNSIYFQILHHLNDGHFYKHTFIALFRQLSSTLPSTFVHWLKQFDFLFATFNYFRVCAFYRFTFALIVNKRSSRRKRSHMDRSGECGGHARNRGIPHFPAHLTYPCAISSCEDTL